jgi:NAD(P)-dependent dehydrogenase (short-subunit alcohol dehydrogenase family)
LTEEIRRAGGKALAVKADVSSQEDVASLFETATKSLGPLGALVNNAGIVEKQARVENMDAARLARVFLVNITGHSYARGKRCAGCP